MLTQPVPIILKREKPAHTEAAMDVRHSQIDGESNSIPAESSKPQTKHYQTATMQKGASLLMEKFSKPAPSHSSPDILPAQNHSFVASSPPSHYTPYTPPVAHHHFISSVVNAVYSPVKSFLSAPHYGTYPSQVQQHRIVGNAFFHPNPYLTKTASGAHPSAPKSSPKK
jgi:hypothetical protein